MSRPLHRTANDAALDQLFGALADRTRRDILGQLANGPAKVGDLAARFQMSWAAVGKHIKKLEKTGLIKRSVVGRNHICSLEPGLLRQPAIWLSFYEEFWTDNLDSLAVYMNENDQER